MNPVCERPFLLLLNLFTDSNEVRNYGKTPTMACYLWFAFPSRTLFPWVFLGVKETIVSYCVVMWVCVLRHLVITTPTAPGNCLEFDSLS